MSSTNSGFSPMEQLTGAVFGRMSLYASPKTFYLCSSESFENLAHAIPTTSAHFGLLILSNASPVPNDTVFRSARQLIDKGLVYLSTWGADCERIHDLFDEEELAGDLDNPHDQGNHNLLTAWHPSDSLEEVLWFFVNHAWPDDSYRETCKDWIVAVVGKTEWDIFVRQHIPKLVTSIIQAGRKPKE